MRINSDYLVQFESFYYKMRLEELSRVPASAVVECLSRDREVAVRASLHRCVVLLSKTH